MNLSLSRLGSSNPGWGVLIRFQIGRNSHPRLVDHIEPYVRAGEYWGSVILRQQSPANHKGYKISSTGPLNALRVAALGTSHRLFSFLIEKGRCIVDS